MKHGLGWLAASLAIAVIVPGGSAWADVLPARRTASSEDASRVASRLVQIGCPPSLAAEQTAALSPSNLSTLAQAPDGIVNVGGLWGEEWVVGLAYLALIVVAYINVVSDTPK